MPIIAIAGLVDATTEMTNELQDRTAATQNALPVAMQHASTNMNGHHGEFTAKTTRNRSILNGVLGAGMPVSARVAALTPVASRPGMGRKAFAPTYDA